MDRPFADPQHDRDLERRVTSFLATRHVPGLRNLEVEAENGVVTVSGQVLTFYEKQLCNQCCRRVAGVLQLINEVDVMHEAKTASLA
jgi:osmotically-inducible protein OsmY